VWPLGGRAPRQVWTTAAPLTPHAVMDREADRFFVGFSHALAIDRQHGVMAVAHAPWWVVPLDGSPIHTFVADGSPSTIRVRDLTSGTEIHVLHQPGDEAIDELKFLPGGALLSAGSGGLLRWDLESGSFEVLREGHVTGVAVAPDGRRALSVGASSGAMVHDLTGGTAWPLASHGLLVTRAAFDGTGSIVVSGDREGVLRIGSVTGEEPHLLFGHEGAITAVDVSPDSTCVVSSGLDSTLRVWSMPVGSPLHTLALEQLLERLREAAAASTLGPVEDPDPVQRSVTDSRRHG